MAKSCDEVVYSERSQIIKDISARYPCHEKIIHKLYKYYGSGDPFPPALYLYGHGVTGKSSILESLFAELGGVRYLKLNVIEAYSNKLLFENIAFGLQDIRLSTHNGYTYAHRLEYTKEFLTELRRLDRSLAYVIVIESAERLRDADQNLLPMLLQLPEATGQNISVVLMSSLPFEKYYIKTGMPSIPKLFVPAYSRDSMLKILSNDFHKIKLDAQKLAHLAGLEHRLELIDRTVTQELYSNFVHLFLSTFWKVCRDVGELRLVVSQCFRYYYEPVIEGTIEANDALKLWRNISMVLKTTFTTLYMRLGSSNLDVDYCHSQMHLVQQLELPYYAKYLLIAAYLASHNPAKEDKRLFLKSHGKQRKRMQTVNARAKVSEKMAVQLGPKAFGIDRLLAIFYAILDGEKVAVTSNLLTQIATLVHLKLLAYVSSADASLLDGTARLQCTVGLDSILQIGRMIGFNVRQYLCDFF
ncbi:origin recognition complex subunit 5 isoform X1 [Anopheles darlingi]|uniref:Origin recognition complex subunit 5 n=1 Tax=Anopheles darlingi TaxID=43151 RepID=A0A675B367_ANODA|nr:origin recognition complex subunit 5 isoform X1 [Anopheles darlingi]